MVLSATLSSGNSFPLPSLLQAIAILVAPAAGQLTHEAAHYIAAHMLGAKPSFNFRIREVMTVTYEEQPLGNELVIGLAPTLSGLIAAVTAVLFFGWPTGGYWLFAVFLAGVFHILPSRADIAGLRQVTGPEEPLSESEEMLFKGFGAMALSALAMATPYNQGYVFNLLALPLAVAGFVMVLAAVLRLERAEVKKTA